MRFGFIRIKNRDANKIRGSLIVRYPRSKSYKVSREKKLIVVKNGLN